MSNYYKRLTYVGLRINKDELLKALKLKDFDEWWELVNEKKIYLNGHDKLMGKFGYIPTDSGFTDYICIGKVIDACMGTSGDEEDCEEQQTDILKEFEKVKYEVAEELRKSGITIGEIKIYAITHSY